MTERAPRVLVVEDELFVAMMIEDYLRDLGFEVVGPALRLERGLALARDEMLDFAVLDVNLADKPSFPIADALRDRGVPFIFATGYGTLGLTEAYQGTRTLQKPFDLHDLAEAIGDGARPS
ncbi:response regulator [Cereibacter sp. SYSU M97828]|nr:response regulator [Cereibacter flavus]